MSSTDGKKSVTEIVIERFLKDVDEMGEMPWQAPYGNYSAFNWVSLKQYRGINRLLLPSGEYLTMNQMIAYNKEHGTNYRLVEDAERFIIVFFKKDDKEVSEKEVEDVLGDISVVKGRKGVLVGGWTYYYWSENDSVRKVRNILRYNTVFERHSFVDENLGVLFGKEETGVVSILRSKPKDIFDSYVKKEGIEIIFSDGGTPRYDVENDIVYLNRLSKSEDYYWSTAFHELIHSTGAASRLDREFIRKCTDINIPESERINWRAKEECVAEIGSSLVCSECDIIDFSTSESEVYENNVAYVQAWKKRIKDWGNSFIYVVSEAEKAYSRVMGESY